MKILGGSETYMFALSNLLKKNDVEVEFWGMEDEDNIVSDNYQTFPKNLNFQEKTGVVNNLSRVPDIIYSKENQNRLSKLLDVFKPDIVHIHNYNFQLTTSILSVIKKRKIKIVHTIHDSQLVCPNHRLYIEHNNEVCTRCLHGKYYNAVVNRCFDNSINKSLVGCFESYLTHTILDVYNKYIDAFVSPSIFFKDLIQPVIKKKIIVLPNCVEKREFTGKASRENYVLFFGRLSIEKGLDRLYELFEKIPFKLKVIGKGDLTPPSHANIEYLGPKYDSELFDYVANAQFTVHPSYWYENNPMSIIESYMMGTPVIVSNRGGLPEMIDDHTGYMMDFFASDALTVLETILKSEYIFDEKEIMEYYTKNYGEQGHVKKIINIYKSVLSI